MIRIIMSGCNGHMGQVISGLVKDDPEAEIVAGIDLVDNRDNGYPVFTNINDCDVQADAMIDFSSAKATEAVLAYCTAKKPVSYTHLDVYKRQHREPPADSLS